MTTLTPEQQRMAREAGLRGLAEAYPAWPKRDWLTDTQVAIAEAACAAGLTEGQRMERERCAKVCENKADDAWDEAWNLACRQCADAIRAAGAEEETP